MRLWSLRWEGGSRRLEPCRKPFIISYKWRWLRKVAAGEVRRETCRAREHQPPPLRRTSSLIVVVSLWKFIIELDSLFCLHRCLLGLILTLLSCSDDKQARRMWSMCSQLANLIFLHAAGSQSHHTILIPYTNVPTHSHAGSPFSFCCICWNGCGPPAPEKAKEGK